MSIFKSVERFIYLFAGFLNILGIISLLAMMMLTVSDVFLRYFFSKPIIGGTELTQCFMVCMALGLGWSALKGKGIKMDLILGQLPLKAQWIIDSLTILMGLAIIIPITIAFFGEISIVKEMMMHTAMLRIPEYPFYFIIGTGLGLFSIVLIILIVKNLAKVVTYER